MNAAPVADAVKRWLDAFGAALERGDRTAALELFADECYWRDLLSFTWNIKTLEGKPEIGAMLDHVLATVRPRGWHLQNDIEATELDGVSEAFCAFETEAARGLAHLRLREGKCWTLLTTMTELKGFEERQGATRELGVEHHARRDRVTWREQREQEWAELGTERQPYCLIVGGGQGGIALGARLRRLGVPTIIIEKNARAGDSWRKRYKSLCLHDPVWYDHLPYLPFPKHWPVFTPKDQMGDWLEVYVQIMAINYWPSSECLAAQYDNDNNEWRVRVNRAGKDIELRPQQLVLATGAYGFAKTPHFPGIDNFQGETLHSSEYHSGEAYRGKKCAIIGSGSSAHDVAVDLWEHGAEVTLVQRSPSIIIRSETLMEVGFGPIYSEQAVACGITTEIADHLFASVPFRLMAQFQKPLYQEIYRRDKAFYDALTTAGFDWNFGDDDSGLMMKALRTASGYYIDVGASQLIIDREIGVKSKVDIERLSANGLQLSDGSELPADVIVFATGYGSLEGVVEKLAGQNLADQLGPFWGYGAGVGGDPGPWQGELRNMWKPTAQSGLWFHGGNLHLSRYYSLHVALQIKARMEGLATPVYR